MQEKLVGYLLDALDADESAHVQGILLSSDEARQQLEVLRRALEPLDGDREAILAPPGLALRTCQRVREQLGLHQPPLDLPPP